MRQRRNGIVILILVLTVLLLLFFVFYSPEDRYQWFETYRADSDQPYGMRFMHELLQGYRPGGEVIDNKRPLRQTLPEIAAPAKTDYILIGQNIFLDAGSKGALVDFMEAGGNVFIATLTPPEDLLPSVYAEECGVPFETALNRTDSVTLNFFHETLRMAEGVNYRFRFMADDHPYFWNYYREELFCDSTRAVIPLGFQHDGHVNFVRIPAGKGNLYLHSNPIVFTNYFLTRQEKLGYASRVLSHLDGEDIIWDEYSKIPFLGDSNAYNSPLYYIMQQPALKYAWWLLLATIVLYVAFAGKRKQRPIPVLEQKTNTSLEYVKLISILHYKNGNHLDMAHKKMRYFLYFVRSKYGLAAEKFNDDQIRRLSEKSKVAYRDVESIFMQYALIEEKFRDYIDAGRLVNLYDAIDYFYKNCK